MLRGGLTTILAHLHRLNLNLGLDLCRRRTSALAVGMPLGENLSGGCSGSGRGEEGASAGGVEVRFIDLDWGGKSGEVRYPLLINTKHQWALPDPVDKPVLQEHDKVMLRRALDACRKLQGDVDVPEAKRPRLD